MSKEAPRNTILVVDDEPELRRGVVRFLASQYTEYEVLEANNGIEALAKLTSEVAIVICDVNMPDMDGFAFCKTVRSRAEYKSLPVILLTARDNEDDYEEGLNVGSTLHVPKPFDNARFHSAIRTILGH